MLHLWKVQKGVLKDIVSEFPDPKPATSTVGTVLGNLVDKEFVDFEKYGRVHVYYPLIEKNVYLKEQFNQLIWSYFNGSVSDFISFFSTYMDLSGSELQRIIKTIEKRMMVLRKV